MNNDIASGNGQCLTIDDLRKAHREASDSAAVALPGTDTHRLRVAHLVRIAAELTRRGG